MELIIILIIFVTAFVIAVNTRKKHVSMENNVSPNNIPSEDGQFKYENRLSMTLSTILCKWKQDSVVSSSYIWILFSNISINWFIINPQL